jgi:hypothetical protein
LTSETQPKAIVDHYKQVNTSTIQIVDQVETDILGDRKGSSIDFAPNLQDLDIIFY